MPECSMPAEILVPLTFYEHGCVIAWGDDSEHFSPSSFRLLKQLWLAKNHTLSKDEVKQDMTHPDETSSESLRTLIKNTRHVMAAVQFPHEIVTLWGKGYTLKGRSQS